MSDYSTIAISITGRTAIGKTVLAQEIAGHLKRLGYEVTLDDLGNGPTDISIDFPSPFADGWIKQDGRKVIIKASIDGK